MLRPIFVRTASQTHALQIHATTDVQTLKAQIALTTGIPVEQQVLTHSGRKLDRGLMSDVQQDNTIHVLCRLLGGQQTVKLTVKPRLQKDKWSMYWKESMCTKTECLENMQIEVDVSAAMSDVTQKIAKQQGWQPVEMLQRLEGFKDPWEFGVYKGRRLKLDQSLADNDITTDATITVVRRMLIPEAWKNITDMNQDDDTSSSDGEDWEQKF